MGRRSRSPREEEPVTMSGIRGALDSKMTELSDKFLEHLGPIRTDVAQVKATVGSLQMHVDDHTRMLKALEDKQKILEEKVSG